MYELIRVSEHDYYVDCPAKIGVVRTGEKEVVFIDGGSDKDAAKKALRILQSNGWELKAIYNTHSHADHIGGNRFLQDRTGCAIYACEMESVYTGSPVLEPAGLYGGRPFKDLKHKFLLAQTSNVLPLTDDVLPEGFKIIRLPGHSCDMVGYKTPDGNAYIGDCVSSEETIAKYGISYLWDVSASLASLEQLKSIEAAFFIPAHAPACSSIIELADKNIEAINGVIDLLLEICKTPIGFDAILKAVFDAYNLSMNPVQYVLIGSTVRSYLSDMYDQGKMTYEFTENTMLWHTV